MTTLEDLFGDPLDTGNPLGHRAFVEADERGELLPAGRKALERFRLNAHFVPERLGGRLGRADDLARLLRPIFRRDAALGLGHGAINLIAAAPVWTAGHPEQQRRLADVLLANGQACGAYTELESGHDLVRAKVRATRHDGEFRLAGRKEMINNIARAHTATVLARTSDEPGSRSHSLLLADMAEVPRDRLRFLPRYRTSGLRAIHLGGVEFVDTPVPGSAIVGEPGAALETVLRAFQVTKAVLTGGIVGILDTQLRTVTRFAQERRLYQRTVAEIPHARSLLTDAYLDLLTCDAFTTTVCRALHVLPAQCSVYAPAVKYLVPTIVQEAVDNLAVVLGARSFLREGEHAVFQKHLRDLPVASLAHAGTTVCQAQLIPQLPRLAKRSWLRTAPAPAALFRLDESLPELDFTRLVVMASANDGLAATLTAEPIDDAVLGPLVTIFVDELRALAKQIPELRPTDRGPLAGPIAFDLADRYTVVLAAASCLGVWRHNPGDPAWVIAALARLATRLGHPAATVAPIDGIRDARQAVFADLLDRHDRGRGFDLLG